MVESFNSWIEEARSNKPVVDLIDMIRGMLMEQCSQQKLNSNSWKSPLIPCVEEYIRDVTTTKEHFIIRRSNPTNAEVEGIKDRLEVNIENHMCTCGFWQLSGLPCVHAAAFVGMSHQNLWHTYIDEHYYSYRYIMAYERAISTLPGKEQWSIPTDSIFVSPPVSIRPWGRPKKRRIKNFLEGAKKSKTNHKCGRCNSWGHHRSTCKEPLSLDDENIQPIFFGKIPIRHPNSQTYAT
ncbi:ubiquitin-conjugating enzyme E2 S [Dendrobium catenatum]|uniref:Ubiquitin-conjugating enzyme E2 S n=1 Tax=Dendrobium catenatum TaxID=906689 RepID=A0A2I0WHN1_9ASPA|nr:ubiquitin-conjugating enzyme E2 S [Dendrobium catenatum]